MYRKRKFPVRNKNPLSATAFEVVNEVTAIPTLTNWMVQYRKPEVAYTEHVEFSEEEWLRTITGKIVLVSISPEDKEWMDKHCPEWEEHISSLPFEGDVKISELVLDEIRRTPERMMAILKGLRHELVYHLATEIIDHMEPEISGFEERSRLIPPSDLL